MDNIITENDYKEKIVIFMDILGTSEYIGNEEKLIKFYNYINNILKKVYEIVGQEYSGDAAHGNNIYSVSLQLNKIKDLDFSFSLLGDAFVISFNKEYGILALPMLIRHMRIIYLLSILELGSICRGAVSFGKIYHKENSPTIFGDGLANAALIEKKDHFPRISIDEALTQEYQSILDNEEALSLVFNEYKKTNAIVEKGFQTSKGELIKVLHNQIFCKDTDGKQILDLFSASGITLKDLGATLQKNITFDSIKDIFESNITRLEELIKKGVDISEHNKQLLKWRYILKKLEESKKQG